MLVHTKQVQGKYMQGKYIQGKYIQNKYKASTCKASTYKASTYKTSTRQVHTRQVHTKLYHQHAIKNHNQDVNFLLHCKKSIQIRSIFWSVFSRIWTDYERYSVCLRIQSECVKIRTRKNSVFEHFSRSVISYLIVHNL